MTLLHLLDRYGDEARAVLALADRDPALKSPMVPGLPYLKAEAVFAARHADEVANVVRIANDARVPVTAAAGRSGVCGASVPVHGGIVLDLTALSGIVDVDDTSMLLSVQAGTFGNVLEDELRATYNKTLGHWPKNISATGKAPPANTCHRTLTSRPLGPSP